MKNKSKLLLFLSLVLFTVIGTTQVRASFTEDKNPSIAILSENVVLVPGMDKPLTFEIKNSEFTEGVWSVDDESVVSISSDGLLTGLNIGETTVRVSILGNEKVSSSIIVVIIDKEGDMLKDLYSEVNNYLDSEESSQLHQVFIDYIVSILDSTKFILEIIDQGYDVPAELLTGNYDSLLHSYNSRFYDEDYGILINFDQLSLDPYDKSTILEYEEVREYVKPHLADPIRNMKSFSKDRLLYEKAFNKMELLDPNPLSNLIQKAKETLHLYTIESQNDIQLYISEGEEALTFTTTNKVYEDALLNLQESLDRAILVMTQAQVDQINSILEELSLIDRKIYTDESLAIVDDLVEEAMTLLKNDQTPFLDADFMIEKLLTGKSELVKKPVEKPDDKPGDKPDNNDPIEVKPDNPKVKPKLPNTGVKSNHYILQGMIFLGLGVLVSLQVVYRKKSDK